MKDERVRCPSCRAIAIRHRLEPSGIVIIACARCGDPRARFLTRVESVPSGFVTAHGIVVHPNAIEALCESQVRVDHDGGDESDCG